MKIGVSSKTLSQVELTTLARWTIRPRLMAIPGVANVAIWGQRDRQLQVLVDPDRLRASGVTLAEVMTATRDATSVAAGGFIETPNQRLAVAHAPSVKQAADLAIMAVTAGAASGVPGAVRRLGDVADVVEGFPPPIGDGVINDGPGLLLIVEKQPDGNTLQVTRDVEAALAALAPGLAGVDVDPTIFRPATFIEMSIANLNAGAADRLRARRGRAGRVPLGLAHRGHQPHRDPAVAARRGARAALPRRHARHDGHRRAHHRARRGGRRRHHRRREHRAAAAAESLAARAAAGVPGRARRVARGPQRGRLRQPDRRAGVPAGVPARRPGRVVLPAAGAVLRPGDLAPRCSWRSSSRRRCRSCSCRSAVHERESPLVVWLKARYRAVLPRLVAGAAPGHRHRRGLARPSPRWPIRCSARSSCPTSRNTTS